MSAAMENLRNDVQKPPEQLEREADSARSAVEGTLAALEQRLSPGEMLDRVMEMVKRHGGEFGDNLLTQVRGNPLPTIIAGVGMAWLMTASKRPPSRGSGSSGDSEGSSRRNRGYDGDEDIDATERWSSVAAAARDGAVSAATSSTESLKTVASDAFDATTEAAHRAADATSRAAQRVTDATRDVAERVAEASRTSVRGVTDGYAQLCREQPLVLAAIAVAAGAALGALLPSTKAENRLLGETSDAAKSRVTSEARARAGELRDAAADAAEAAKEQWAGVRDEGGGNEAEAQRSESHSAPDSRAEDSAQS